ncbi:formylmethanofuran dehydrogenase [Paraburkholderia solisilvae]|nr:formylmethanofuran dehydrogenase [Paraburkholderia solisilvae]
MHDPTSPAPVAGQAAASAARPVSSSVSSSVTRDWACPFCPLLCDDIEAHVADDATITAPATDCPRLAAALTHYGSADLNCPPSIDGQAVTLDTALAEAADILSHAHRPLFGACATDVAGARALYTLAAACGATLDTLHGDALSAATLAMQDRGAFFTTLSEVRSRADLLVVFGCAPAQHHPRFYERALAGNGDGDSASVAASATATAPRTICFVGCPVDPAAPPIADARCESILADASPHDLLALWSAIAEGRPASVFEKGMPQTAQLATQLATLMERIAAARYTAFIYEPAALPQPHAALLIEALHRIVKAINRTSRAGALALGGADGALTVSQTVTWLSGLPLRTHVSRPDRPEGAAPLDHDPYRYRAERLLDAREVDALLWVTSFAPHALPAALDPQAPAIVFGPPSLASTISPRAARTVFIPVATPGIDSDGHLFRLDTSIVTPLHAARQTNLRTVAALATDLAERVADARRPT